MTGDEPDEIQLDIQRCARCGGDHDGLIFLKLLRPAVIDDTLVATHWSLCPSNGQPIMMTVVDE